MPARRQATGALGIVLVTVGLATSCRQAIGIGDPAPPPSCHAPDFKDAPSCSGCLLDRCCAELDACSADLQCRPLLDCVATCSDDACRAACETKSKLTDTGAALLACQASQCEAPCGLSCGGAGPPITACMPCGGACCAEGTAFRADLDGQRLRACRAACRASDVTCGEACANAHPTGADRELTANECVARTCGVVGQWSCVGKSGIRHATRTTIEIAFHAIDSQTLAPLAGMTVKGCSSSDPTCDVPLFGSAVTDGAGRATITVTLGSMFGADAYSGFLEVTRDDYLPGLLYFLPALTSDSSIGLAMLRRSALAEIEQLAGVSLAPERGALVAQSVDCAGSLRPGASFRASTADVSSRTFYLTNASAGGGTTYDFQATATTEVGTGGVFNVPAGPSNMTARVEDLCLDFGTAHVSVRPGALTVVIVHAL